MARSHFDTPPAEYDAARSGHHGRRQIELFERHVGGAGVVVEIGSGTGFALRDMAARHPDVRFVGLELEQNLVNWARESTRSANVEFYVGDVATVELDVTADVVFSADVIHHFHDHRTAFASVHRLLRPGGAWIAIEPNIWHPYIVVSIERMKRAGYDEDHFRPWRLDPLLREARFRIDDRWYLHLIPSAISDPPRWLAKLEIALERFRLLGGSVVTRLTAV